MRCALLPLTAEADEARKKARHGCEEEEAFRMEKRCLLFFKKNGIQSFTRKG